MNLKKLFNGKRVLSLILAILMVTPTATSFFPQGFNVAKAEDATSTYVPIAVGKTLGECFPGNGDGGEGHIFARYVYEEVLGNDAGDPIDNIIAYEITDEDVVEVEYITNVNIANKSALKDLTGIQNFKKLQQLFIQINC